MPYQREKKRKEHHQSQVSKNKNVININIGKGGGGGGGGGGKRRKKGGGGGGGGGGFDPLAYNEAISMSTPHTNYVPVINTQQSDPVVVQPQVIQQDTRPSFWDIVQQGLGYGIAGRIAGGGGSTNNYYSGGQEQQPDPPLPRGPPSSVRPTNPLPPRPPRAPADPPLPRGPPSSVRPTNPPTELTAAAAAANPSIFTKFAKRFKNALGFSSSVPKVSPAPTPGVRPRSTSEPTSETYNGFPGIRITDAKENYFNARTITPAKPEPGGVIYPSPHAGAARYVNKDLRGILDVTPVTPAQPATSRMSLETELGNLEQNYKVNVKKEKVDTILDRLNKAVGADSKEVNSASPPPHLAINVKGSPSTEDREKFTKDEEKGYWVSHRGSRIHGGSSDTPTSNKFSLLSEPEPKSKQALRQRNIKKEGSATSAMSHSEFERQSLLHEDNPDSASFEVEDSSGKKKESSLVKAYRVMGRWGQTLQDFARSVTSPVTRQQKNNSKRHYIAVKDK